MQCPQDMAPPLKRGDRASILANHVQAAETYQACRGPHNALVQTVCQQQGVTINGGPASSLPECRDVLNVKK